MKRTVSLIAAPALLALALSACSQKAQDETSEAANTIAADVNATAAQAASDVEQASDNAFGAAEESMDNATDKIGQGLKDTGNAIQD